MGTEELFKFVHNISCSINNVDYDSSFTKSRVKDIVSARYMTFAAFRERTHMSLSDIGSVFNKDHATVLHGVKQVSNLSETDKLYEKKYNELLRQTYVTFKKYVPHIRRNSAGDEIKEALFSNNISQVRINIRAIVEKYNL